MSIPISVSASLNVQLSSSNTLKKKQLPIYRISSYFRTWQGANFSERGLQAVAISKLYLFTLKGELCIKI